MRKQGVNVCRGERVILSNMLLRLERLERPTSEHTGCTITREDLQSFNNMWPVKDLPTGSFSCVLKTEKGPGSVAVATASCC